MTISIVPVAEADKPLLWARMQHYIRELMPFESDTPDDGPYDYPYFDQYWREPDARWPFWGEVNGTRAAFALVRRLPERFEMAEFYSFPEFRRTGVALPFARAVMARFPGPWELSEFAVHTAAVAFWKRVLGDTPFTESSYIGETSGKARLRQVFTIPSSP